MERQNITLSLPKELLKEVKHAAVEEGTSVSGLLVRYLEMMLKRNKAYDEAMQSLSRRMRAGYDLGTGGTSSWTREELHGR